MKSRIKGKFAFQTAGVFFILSAVLELFSIASPIPLFGNVRGGLIAITYHLIYTALYFSMGFGLYKAKPFTYRLIFITTGLYTLDRLIYVLDRKALEIYLGTLLKKYGLSIGISETDYILKILLVATALIVVCWWGFAGYTYLRREYFHRSES